MKNYFLLAVFTLCIIVSDAVLAQSGNIYTFAGNGTAGFSGDGGAATLASFNQPTDVFEDTHGNFYICDKGNNRIRMINTSGIVSTIVGTGAAGYTGDGGLASLATLNSPNRVFVDAPGNIYIADESNNVIRMVNTLGIISTIAGTGTSGYTGDGGLAVTAELSTPTGVAVDYMGNIYISDMGNARIRKINTSGIISTYAGGGGTGYTVDGVPATSLSMCTLEYVSVDDTGNVYFSNHGCWHFFKVNLAGLIYDVAGDVSPSYSGDCGPADSANIHFPFGITPDNLGNIYICPAGNFRVRRVNIYHIITTVAGDGTVGYTGDGGLATLAEISSSINGIYADNIGNVYFADEGNNVIRNFTVRPYADTITMCPGTIDSVTDTITVGSWSSSDTGIAQVNASGIVTAINPGSALIYNASDCNTIYLVKVDSLPCSAYSCNSITMPDTMSTCAGDTLLMNATIVGHDSVLSTVWTPGTGLSNDSILNPSVYTGTASGWYYLTVNSLIPENLVINGTFASGNVGFSSTYNYVFTAGGDNPGDYEVGNNPSFFNPGWPVITDPSGVTGNMLCVDGSLTAGMSFWCESITVSPGTNYVFSFYTTLFSAPLPSIQVTINGTPVETVSTSTIPGVWTQYTIIWNSGTATSADICMTDLNTTYVGNDFGIDDISFEPICVSTDSVYISVTIPDTTYTNMDTLLCMSPYSLVLNAPADFSTYIWNTGATTVAITATVSGTYWVLAKAGCTEQSDTFQVTFHTPPAVLLGNDTSLCVGDTLTLNSPQPVSATFLWNTGATTSSIIVTTTGTYWLQVTDSSCTTTDTIDAAFHMIPVVSLGNNDTLCMGQTQTLLTVQPPGSTYLWNTGSTSNTIMVTATGNYWVAVTDSGCTGSDTVLVYFHPLPVVALGADTAFCVGDTITLTSVQPVTAIFTWSTGYAGDTIMVDSTGTYWLTVTDSGCTASDTIHVLVSPHPVVNLGPDTAVCMADVLASLDSYAVAAYLWNTGSVTDTIHVGTSGSYWLQVTVAGCSSADTVQVAVYYDTFRVYNMDTAICLGAVVQVVTSPADSATIYQWIPTAGIRYSTMPDPLITPDTSAMYVVTVTSPACPPIVDSFYIDVEPNPTLFISNDRSVCQFDTIHLNALVSPAWYTQYTYSWSPTQVFDHTNTPTVVFSSPTTTTVYLTVSTPAGCDATDSVLVVVHPNGFGLITGDTTICPHDSVLLVASGGNSYQWYPSLYLEDANSGQTWAHPVTTQLYTVIATSIFGCLDTMHVNISVQPSGYVKLPDSVILYPGQTYQMDPLTNCVNFSWFPPAGLSSFIISNPIASPGVTTKYIVTASDDFGCSAVDTINVIIDPSTLLAIPNAFTPGSGPNNILYILKLGEATLNYFNIYNRWGNQVFGTNNIDAGWDGTYKGTPQPEDVYIYEIQAVTNTGTVFTKKGNITLLR